MQGSLELRCRVVEAIAVVDRAAAVHGIQPGELTLGSNNGSAFTARRFRGRLTELGIRHRRGGYRDPESHAFIESWFGKAQGTGGVAERVRDPRRRPPRDRPLRRALPPPAPLAARLPDTPRGCAGPGRICRDYKNTRPSLSTPTGSTSHGRAQFYFLFELANDGCQERRLLEAAVGPNTRSQNLRWNIVTLTPLRRVP
jgi:transposase InsO family protein